MVGWGFTRRSDKTGVKADQIELSAAVAAREGRGIHCSSHFREHERIPVIELITAVSPYGAGPAR